MFSTPHPDDHLAALMAQSARETRARMIRSNQINARGSQFHGEKITKPGRMAEVLQAIDRRLGQNFTRLDIIEATGFEQSVVRKAFNQLQVLGHICRVDQRDGARGVVYQRIPEGR